MSRLQNLTIGQRLRYERERLNWSQEELAQQIGTTPLSINRWEHDRAFPRPRYRAELCRVFDKSAEALFEMLEEQEHASIWNVPHPRNLYFTGREAILARLRDTFSAKNAIALTQAQAVHGLGGIGKTQLAIEYAYRYKSEYKAVLWTKADSLQSLISDFVTHADTLGLPEKDDPDQQRVVNAVRRWLHTHSPWLLILDNADDLELIYDFLSLGDGHILVTTRCSATGPHIKGIELDKMGRGEGTLLLLRRSKRLAEDAGLESVIEPERSNAEAIYELMDGLPLALDQAAAYIEENQCGLGDYLQLYRSHRAALLQRRGAFSKRDYPHSVATTWSLSFEQLEQADPIAAAVLRLCAFLHPDAIPEEMLIAGAAALNTGLRCIADDPMRLNSAIGELRRYSLIRRNAETKMLTIHRLLQTVLRDAMTKESEKQWVEQAVHVVSQAFPGNESAAWQQCERYLPHALTCVEWIEQWGMQSNEAARLLSRAGYHLYDRGQYSEAESLCQRALSIREQMLGLDHPDVAESLNDLAVLAIARGKYDQAESLCQRALFIQEQMLGPDHSDVAITLNDLAMIHYLQSKYEGVEPLYQRAISIFERTLGRIHSYTAGAVNNLAKLYVAQGKYAEAELLMQQALSIREQVYGPDHPDVANSFGNLAKLAVAWGKYAEAESFYRRALAIQEQVLQPYSHGLAGTRRDLARVLLIQNRCEEAEPFYYRALTIYEHVWGPEHPELRQMIEEYADLQRKMSQKV